MTDMEIMGLIIAVLFFIGTWFILQVLNIIEKLIKRIEELERKEDEIL